MDAGWDPTCRTLGHEEPLEGTPLPTTSKMDGKLHRGQGATKLECTNVVCGISCFEKWHSKRGKSIRNRQRQAAVFVSTQIEPGIIKAFVFLFVLLGGWGGGGVEV